MSTPAATAYDTAEWDSAVAALAENAPTIAAPANDPSKTIAVGGGRFSAGAGSSPRFGFGATLGPNGPTGEMNMSVGVPATTFHARVTCLAAEVLPTGEGFATIIGERTPTPPPDEFPLMVFTVRDGGGPDGSTDGWAATFVEEFPCEPIVIPPTGMVGNIVVQAPTTLSGG